MLSTFNQSIRLIIGRRFYRINSEDCTSKGYQDISTLNDCELAAYALGLTDTSAYSGQVKDRPYGCIYSTRDWLGFCSEDDFGYRNVPCGALQGDTRYDCLCLKGNI